tara:strand:- start:230 stop:541 length:312 start_codon:yes stop_codon:yes gene_type:complete
MNYWTTKDGNKIAVKDLDDKHLLNILSMLKAKNHIYGMRISRMGTSSYSIDKNREQLNLILGEGAYISCAIQRAKDDLIRWVQEKRFEYECETGIDYDNRLLM